MKATFALTLANALLVASNPLQQRAYVTEVDVKTVTQFVYPDGSPATHLGAQPTGTYAEPAQGKPSQGKPEAPSSPAPEKPSADEGEEEPPTSQPAPGGSAGTVYQASINAHNAHRTNHTCGDIAWDDNLASYAQQLADTCEYRHDGDIGGGGYGQNIAMGAESNYELTDVEAITRAITRQWYNNEFEIYPQFGSEPDKAKFEEWGHLTQILWKDTKKIGCAIAKCPPGKLTANLEGYFAVCNYSPPGNVPGSYATNVLPPTKNFEVLPA